MRLGVATAAAVLVAYPGARPRPQMMLYALHVADL